MSLASLSLPPLEEWFRAQILDLHGLGSNHDPPILAV